MPGRGEYRISVTGLPSDITHSQLKDAFNRYGRILHSKAWRERVPGGSGSFTGHGYVIYETRQGMEDAIVIMHGMQLRGHVLTVKKAPSITTVSYSRYGYSGGNSSGRKRGRNGGCSGHERRTRSSGSSSCYQCGDPDHVAEDCYEHHVGNAGGGYKEQGGPSSNQCRDDGGNGGTETQQTKPVEMDVKPTEAELNRPPKRNSKPCQTEPASDIFGNLEGGKDDMVGHKEKTTKIEGFSVQSKYSALYKSVYERHGHIATNIVIKDSAVALFALVADLLGVIKQMKETSYANLSESLLKHWDSKVATAEAVKFNVGWLRNRVNELKTEFASGETSQSVPDKDEEALKATREDFMMASETQELLRVELLRAEKHVDEVQKRLKACKAKVEANAAEKKRKASQSVLNELL